MSMTSDQEAIANGQNAVALFLAVVAASVLVANIRYGVIADGDTFWHLMTGQWIVENGQVPRSDPFSHSFKGQPWIAKEWLSQVLFYAAYSVASWKGVLLLTAGSVFAAIFLVSRFCMSRYRLSVAIGTVCVLALFASTHFISRPHILTYPIMVIWVIELTRAADERRVPRLWLVPLMLLWANLHGGFTVGLILAGVFAVDTVLRVDPALRISAVAKHLLLLILIGLAPMINPYGFESMLMTQKILSLSSALNEIAEWKPLDFRQYQFHFIVLIGLVGGALFSGLRVRRFSIVAILFLVASMLTYARFVPIFALLMPIALASPITRQFAIARAQSDANEWASDPVVSNIVKHHRKIVLISVLILSVSIISLIKANDFDLKVKRYSFDAVEFAKFAQIEGNVLNQYGLGGFLIYQGIEPGIDGRAELYGNSYYTRYSDAVNNPGNTNALSFLDQLKIEWTLLAPRANLNAVLSASSTWTCVYSDNSGVIFVRRLSKNVALESRVCEYN